MPRGAPAPFSLRMLDNDNTFNTTNLQLPHDTSYNELQSSRSVFLTCCNCMSQYGIRGHYEHPSVALGSLPSQPICRDIMRGSWRSLLPDCHLGTTPRVSSCTPSMLCMTPTHRVRQGAGTVRPTPFFQSRSTLQCGWQTILNIKPDSGAKCELIVL